MIFAVGAKGRIKTMADKRYIDADKLTFSRVRIIHSDGTIGGWHAVVMSSVIKDAPAADVVEVEKVAEMLRAMFDDDCACNYNGNDEWLPHVCEYGCTECPDAPEENGCWKQFVKHFLAKMDGERKEQT
jgi:hypothetical protein